MPLQNLCRRSTLRSSQTNATENGSERSDQPNSLSPTSRNSSRLSLRSSNHGSSATLANGTNAPDEEEVQELVVQLPSNNPAEGSAFPRANNTALNPEFLAPSWDPAEDANRENLRREAIRKEVERVQRANFIHFALLCMVPTSLLLIVIVAIVSEDGDCDGGELTVCEREARNFVNAFTTRCICDAVRVVTEEELDEDDLTSG